MTLGPLTASSPPRLQWPGRSLRGYWGLSPAWNSLPPPPLPLLSPRAGALPPRISSEALAVFFPPILWEGSRPSPSPPSLVGVQGVLSSPLPCSAEARLSCGPLGWGFQSSLFPSSHGGSAGRSPLLPTAVTPSQSRCCFGVSKEALCGFSLTLHTGTRGVSAEQLES